MIKQLNQTNESITEAQTNKKVYTHMLERIKQERAVLKQKMLILEQHLDRKGHEFNKKLTKSR